MGDTTKTILLCGVGGQGTILAADLLAHAALAAGLDVKVSEIHGMAQRGGAVTTEALRNLPFLAEGGALIVNDEAIKPLPVLTGKAAMPARARADLLDAGALLVPAAAIAREAGNAKTSNVVLLGALSARLDFPAEAWESTVAARVPAKTVEANLAALRAGRAFICEKEGER